LNVSFNLMQCPPQQLREKHKALSETFTHAPPLHVLHSPQAPQLM